MNHPQPAATTDPSNQQNGRPAYVAPPGVSITSLLVNLPCLIITERPSPVILMDQYDYNRLRRQALQPGSSQTCQYLLMAYDELSRRGTIQLIDYADYYQRLIQKKTLQQNRALIEAIPDAVHRRTAIQANDDWIEYGRGLYQQQLRTGLGDQGFTDARHLDKTRSLVMDRGRGTPVEWNKRVLNRYTAALAIRQQADDVLNLNVKHVIGEGESTLIGSIREESGTAVNISHIDYLKPGQHIEELTPRQTATTRELFDIIGTIAVEMTGVQHDDWVMLGPAFAIPRYTELFDFETIQDEISTIRDPETLVEDVAQVIDTLEQGTVDGVSSSTFTYNVDWAAEMTDSSFTTEGSQRQGLDEMATYALTLAQYSRDLHTQVDQGAVSQTAAFIGASIVNDPSHTYDNYTIQQQTNHLIGQIDPPAIDQSQIDANLRRKEVWDHEADWYEVADRAR